MPQYTIEEVDQIAERINEKLNIPIIGEKVEGFFIRILIREFERFVFQKYNKFLSDIMDPDSPDEITDDERIAIENLADDINKDVNIPFIGERKEGRIINAVITFIASRG